MFVYKNKKVNLNSSEAKANKSKPLRKSEDSSHRTEKVITSKLNSVKKSHSKKLTKKNKEFLKQLGFTLKK